MTWPRLSFLVVMFLVVSLLLLAPMLIVPVVFGISRSPFVRRTATLVCLAVMPIALFFAVQSGFPPAYMIVTVFAWIPQMVGLLDVSLSK